jgi:hypothetical protein
MFNYEKTSIRIPIPDHAKINHERLRRVLWIKTYLERLTGAAPDYAANSAVEYFDKFFSEKQEK